MRKMTKEQFIIKAIAKHGDRFNYSKVVYVNNCTNVIIICPDHGEYDQTPDNHLQGKGCPKCKVEKLSKDRLFTIQEFIQKARTIHGDKFDYSKVNYLGMFTKICIICPTHGEFWKSPRHHLTQEGCPKCSNKFRPTTIDWIQKAKSLHGDKYDYSKVIYINNYTKVIIICPIHGEFEQIAYIHLSGHGCPKCNASKGELALEEIFKKYNIQYEPQYNIPEIVANYEIDFYLPEYRLLIEFHGKQHYEYIPFFHDGKYTFEDQKARDDMVRDAAIRWKYNYLEFNCKQYKHLSKDQFEELVIGSINKFKKINIT